MCEHPDRRVERFCENMQTRFLADPPTQPTDNDEVRSAVASRLQTSGSKNTDNGSRENAKQSLLEFNPHHLCGRAKFVGMIFHLINDVETDFEEELPGIPKQVAGLSLSAVSVTRPRRVRIETNREKISPLMWSSKQGGLCMHCASLQ